MHGHRASSCIFHKDVEAEKEPVSAVRTKALLAHYEHAAACKSPLAEPAAIILGFYQDGCFPHPADLSHGFSPAEPLRLVDPSCPFPHTRTAPDYRMVHPDCVEFLPSTQPTDELAFSIIKLRPHPTKVQFARVKLFASLLKLEIPISVLKSYSQRFCSHFGLELVGLAEEPSKLKLSTRWSEAALLWLRGSHVLDRIQELHTLHVPDAPPPFMLHNMRNACEWLYLMIERAKTEGLPDAFSSYVIAYSILPKLLLPLHGDDYFGTHRLKLFMEGSFEELFAFARRPLKSPKRAPLHKVQGLLPDLDPSRIEGARDFITPRAHKAAAAHVGDYQPAQATRALLQSAPPENTAEVRQKYSVHVLQWKDSFEVHAARQARVDLWA